MIYADVLNDDCITWLYCGTARADIMQQQQRSADTDKKNAFKHSIPDLNVHTHGR